MTRLRHRWAILRLRLDTLRLRFDIWRLNRSAERTVGKIARDLGVSRGDVWAYLQRRRR